MDWEETTGTRFGLLVVIGEGQKGIRGHAQYLCACDCGNEYLARIDRLKSGRIKSCGCYRKSGAHIVHRPKHGMCHSPEYRCWKSMKQRCGNPKTKAARHYIDRGISYCAQWNDFETFYKDVGPRPSLKHSLERLNNDGNYEPGNVAWRTQAFQMNNTRSNHRLTHNGKTLNMTQWARELGFDSKVLDSRINQLGWSTERALTTPVKQHAKLTPELVQEIRRRVSLGLSTQSQLSREYGVHPTTINNVITGKRWKP